MTLLAKIVSCAKTISTPLQRLLKPQDAKISQVTQKICKICLCETNLDQLQTLSHQKNLNCKAHKKRYVCINCAPRITVKKCPFCRGNLAIPIRTRCIMLFRQFTCLDPIEESLAERLCNAAFHSVIVGACMGSIGALLALGEGLAPHYGYSLNPEICKVIIYGCLGSGYPLGAIYGFLFPSILSLPSD